jgi:hypothetical protein
MRRSIHIALTALATVAPTLSGQAAPTGPSVQGFLFGDFVYADTEGSASDGFRLGQIVGHANGTLSDHVLFFGEMSITYSGPAYAVSMERAILRYDFSDALKVSVGRFHTPISYWNTAYHHGLWLQNSVARPEPVRFGTPFIPVHFVGAMAEGRIPNTPLHYMGGVGNGLSSNGIGAQDGGDANSNRAVILSASIQPQALPGLRVGGGVYMDRLPDAGQTDEFIWSGHLVWEHGMLDLIAEYIDVSHQPANGGGSVGSSAYYIHAGVRLPGQLNQLMPYGRWEHMNIGAADPVFGSVLPDYEAVVTGVRYDLDAPAAIKAEYRNEKRGAAPRTDAFYVQASFALAMGGQS